MDNKNIKWLTTVPATDANFKRRLRRATNEEISKALLIVNKESKKGNVSRMVALLREQKKREKVKEWE